MKTLSTITLIMMLAGQVLADSGKDYYIVASEYGDPDSGTIQKLKDQTGLQSRPIVLDGRIWTITNNLTLSSTRQWIIPYGTTISVNTNVVLTCSGAVIEWARDGIFTGLGLVTGTVVCGISYHDTWRGNISGYGLTGGTLNDTNVYLTTLTEFSGMVTGKYNNLTVIPDGIESNMLDDASVHLFHLGDDVLNSLTNKLATKAESEAFFARAGAQGTAFDLWSYTAVGTQTGGGTGWNWTNGPLDRVDYDPGANFTNTGGHGYAYITPVNGTYWLSVHLTAFIPYATAMTNVWRMSIGVIGDRPDVGTLGVWDTTATTGAADYQLVGFSDQWVPSPKELLITPDLVWNRTATFEYTMVAGTYVYPVVQIWNIQDPASTVYTLNSGGALGSFYFCGGLKYAD